jgi:hypothetical protein
MEKYEETGNRSRVQRFRGSKALDNDVAKPAFFRGFRGFIFSLFPNPER